MNERLIDHLKRPLNPPAEAPVASPCTNVCRIDAASGWCEGCLRTLDEIALWSALDEAARRAVCADLVLRRETSAQAPLPTHAKHT
jgi:uncharacterized protein